MNTRKTPEQKLKAAVIAARTKQRQLNMTDEDYRAMLFARTGKSSTKDLTLTELGLVNNYLTSLGAVNPTGANADRKKRGRPAEERIPLMNMVRKKLDELRELNGNQSGTYTLSYADAICKRNGWCARVDFADVHILHKLVGALMRTVGSERKKANRTT